MTNNIQIPWKNFTEEEIQTFISMLFHSIGYNIEELHKSDRANENGANSNHYLNSSTISII